MNRDELKQASKEHKKIVKVAPEIVDAILASGGSLKQYTQYLLDQDIKKTKRMIYEK